MDQVSINLSHLLNEISPWPWTVVLALSIAVNALVRWARDRDDTELARQIIASDRPDAGELLDCVARLAKSRHGPRARWRRWGAR